MRPAVVHVRIAVSKRDPRIGATHRPTAEPRAICGGTITAYDVSRGVAARMTAAEVRAFGVCGACLRALAATLQPPTPTSPER